MYERYVHQKLNEEVRAIGGHYVVTKEFRLPLDQKEILVTIGYGVTDTACCGGGGCAFANVYGYVVEWRNELNAEGLPISLVDPIKDESVKNYLKQELIKQETIQQVNFL